MEYDIQNSNTQKSMIFVSRSAREVFTCILCRRALIKLLHLARRRRQPSKNIYLCRANSLHFMRYLKYRWKLKKFMLRPILRSLNGTSNLDIRSHSVELDTFYVQFHIRFHGRAYFTKLANIIAEAKSCFVSRYFHWTRHDRVGYVVRLF